MIIKKLKLENIRSYEAQEVDFPKGKTLFEGDIGSGKSTILMAIEFALFGLGSEKPGSLLKAGENEGSVSIVFESGGRNYTVQRRLIRKRNSYTQDDCALATDEGVSHFSASEIKERVLEILDFNEPQDPKAQSVIFRYAIYTPQEEIKAVLALKPDLRLQTLRKAFRLEDYKIANENAKNLHSVIRQKSRDYDRDASEIPILKQKIDQLRQWSEERSKAFAADQKKQEEVRIRLEALRLKQEELEREQLSLKSDAGRVQDLSSQIASNEGEIKSATTQIRSLESKLALITPRIESLNTVKDPTQVIMGNLQDEIRTLKQDEKKLRSNETMIKSKLEDYESILKEKICPTCDQKIETDSFEERLEHKRKELYEASAKVEECSTSIEHLEKTLEAKRSYEHAQQNLRELVRNQSEYLEGLSSFKARLEAAKKSLAESSEQLARVTESVRKLNEIDVALRKEKDEIRKLDDENELLSRAIARSTTQIEDGKKQEDEFKESLKKKEKAKSNSERLNEFLIWIQDYFTPTVEAIEKQVLLNINLEFDSQFQKWFGMLIDDPGKQARIDEDFTPIIQQDGLDQDVSYLSGGEKTSVALAYRLALNSIVRKVSTGMHSNVLILDEPTDGFSKEQLGRVREILDELDCPQVILVSHEKELESFADQIFRVRKSNGVSTISSS